MNERNVEALRVLLEEEERERNVADEYVHSPAELRAQFLASRGVLVPSVLTVEAQLALDAAVECFPRDDKALYQTIQVLERIAKGETE